MHRHTRLYPGAPVLEAYSPWLSHLPSPCLGALPSVRSSNTEDLADERAGVTSSIGEVLSHMSTEGARVQTLFYTNLVTLFLVWEGLESSLLYGVIDLWRMKYVNLRGEKCPQSCDADKVI